MTRTATASTSRCAAMTGSAPARGATDARAVHLLRQDHLHRVEPVEQRHAQHRGEGGARDLRLRGDDEAGCLAAELVRHHDPRERADAREESLHGATAQLRGRQEVFGHRLASEEDRGSPGVAASHAVSVVSRRRTAYAVALVGGRATSSTACGRGPRRHDPPRDRRERSSAPCACYVMAARRAWTPAPPRLMATCRGARGRGGASWPHVAGGAAGATRHGRSGVAGVRASRRGRSAGAGA